MYTERERDIGGERINIFLKKAFINCYLELFECLKIQQPGRW